MFFFALMLACTGRPSSTPQPVMTPVVEVPVAGGEVVEDAAAEDAAAEDAATEDAATGDAATEDAATEDAATEDAATEDAVDVSAEAAADGEASSGDGLLADGDSCLSGGDCASGICEGEGCSEDTPGICMSRARPCTRDLRAYCGCNGETFRTSGSCPGKRYASRSACENDPIPNLPITPP